mmetsp:Transcript_83037/g.240248  ORF Transcript_83037/g.240248 Transcript_83037/m.240248 type:complete len:892 (+) Transcript_83037:172-2847(+)
MAVLAMSPVELSESVLNGSEEESRNVKWTYSDDEILPVSVDSNTAAVNTAGEPADHHELFEGPEKTLSLSFKARKIAAGSLRLIPQQEWEEILKHAKCEILSVVDSNPAVAPAVKSADGKKTSKVASTRGLTGYLLSESSLFLSDTTLTLKTCGRTTPLAALEPILDLVIPSWKSKEPQQYLKYASFMRLGYMRPDEQIEPHTSWEQEVQFMDKHFTGEAVALGSEAASMQHIYVANYLPKDEVSDTFSTQVALTNLDTNESMHRYGGGEDGLADGVDRAPLASAWPSLHGDSKRSVAKDVKFDEKFFEPIGYSANAVSGRHFTTVHITPQPGCSYVSVETSMPLNSEARKRFVQGSVGMSTSNTIAVTEFALSPQLFNGASPPEIPGFEVRRSTQTIGSAFAAAHHHYERLPAHCYNSVVRTSTMSTCSPMVSPAASPLLKATPPTFEPPPRDLDAVPAVFFQEDRALPSQPSAEKQSKPATLKVEAPSEAAAAVMAAKSFLKGQGDAPKDQLVALVDLAAMRRQVDTWTRLLPRVEPFYAVKCNPHPVMVDTFWREWQERGVGGFDCASPVEIDLVKQFGDETIDRMVFANPCKQESAVLYAREVGLRRLAFDNLAELDKIQALYPEAELMLRVQTDDKHAQCPLSNKYGAALEDVPELLAKARALGLQVSGVCFHVGSGCSERGAFREAFRRARFAFDEAERHGFNMTLLDIGGGFLGRDEAGLATFADHAADINEVLEELFPSPSLKVIAEPGRFLVARAQSMLTTVVSVAKSSTGDRYYLNDGLYGSFNCLLFDHATVSTPIVLRDGEELPEQDLAEKGQCTLFGPTCDGFDMISDSLRLPKLRVGDRLVFPDMGAYTTAAGTRFNGFGNATAYVYESRLAERGDA